MGNGDLQPSATEWDARAYQRLSAPQFAWGQRVLDRVPTEGIRDVLDAGCGTGRLTAELLERLPGARVVGLDRSANMVDEAARLLSPRFGDRASFRQGDLLDVADERAFDLVFSTATFHWVLDPGRLFRTLFRALRPGGVLVAQCGALGNLARLRDRIDGQMIEGAYAPHFVGWSEPWEFASVEATAARLGAAGFVGVEVGYEEADTPFEGAEAFGDFLERVVLGAHLARLPEALRGPFVASLVRAAAGDDPPFVLDYRRLDLKARRPAHGESA